MNAPQKNSYIIRAFTAVFLFLLLSNFIGTNHAFAGVTVPCRAYIGHPLPSQELPIDYRTTREECPTGTTEGTTTITGSVYGAPVGTTITVKSTFLHGRPSGRTSISSSFGLSFEGDIQSNGTVVGKTTYPDGHTDEGTSSRGKLVTGMITRPTSMGGGVNYFVQGASVSQEQYVSFISQNIRSPTRTLASNEVAEANNLPVVSSTREHYSEGNSDTSQCYADRPTAWYTVTGTFEGECVRGNFTGRAEMHLVPKNPQDAAMTITAPYRDGLISGDVEIQYPQLNTVYRGSLQQWSPYTGRMSKNLGNRTYFVSEFRNGETVSNRTEYKPPSEFETAFWGLLSAELNKGINRTIDGAFNGAEKRRNQRIAQAEAQQNQQMLTAQQNQNTSSQTNVYQNTQSSKASVSERENTNPPASLLQAGAPLGQRVTQSTQQTSIFGGNTSPPTTEQNTPTFGGNASPQAPIVSTQPQADSGVPPPVRNEQPLPSPVQVANTPVSSLPPPVQLSNPLPAPTSSYSGNTPNPLPAPFSNGTIGTGQTDNSNVPAPFTIGNSNYSQTSNPVRTNSPTYGQSSNTPDTPVSSKATVSIPNTPTGLYPTATFALAQPIPLGWSAVSGATRYRVAVKDLNTGAFPVDDVFVSSLIYSVGNLAAGHNFAWDVAACNSAGCSARSANGTFRTGGTPSSSTINTSTNTTPNLARDTFDNATQGTKDCAIALARQTGESVEAAYQIITAAGGWQQLANSAANSVWNIIAHPILSAQAAWQGLRGQVGGVRDAVNSGNASLACQRAVALSGTVIGAAEGASFARSSLSNLRKVISQSDEIASSAVAKSAIKSRGIWDAAYSVTRGDIIHHRLGQNTPDNFPVFDIWNRSTGRAVSIKSMDTLLPSYQSASTFQRQINIYVDAVVNFKTTTWDGLKIDTDHIRSRELLLAVPPEGFTTPQLSVLQSIRDRASSLGVRIIIQQIQ